MKLRFLVGRAPKRDINQSSIQEESHLTEFRQSQLHHLMLKNNRKI